jgi:hypothetical protein
MGTSTNSQIQLKPYPITLSALHLSAPLSALHKQSGIELVLPKSTTNGPERFKATIMESNTENLILKPFFTANIQDKIFDGIKYAKTPLANAGISRCAFTTTFRRMQGQPDFTIKQHRNSMLMVYQVSPSCTKATHSPVYSLSAITSSLARSLNHNSSWSWE